MIVSTNDVCAFAIIRLKFSVPIWLTRIEMILITSSEMTSIITSWTSFGYAELMTQPN